MAIFKYHAYKIVGNFGAGFLAPLLGGGFADLFTKDPISASTLLIVSVISSAITTSLSAFNELRIYGETNGQTH